MTQKKIIFCTILSLLLVAAFFPASALGSPRGQMDRQGFSVGMESGGEQPRQETPVPNPISVPNDPAPSNPAPPQNGSSGSGSGSSTYSPTRGSLRSGGFTPSDPAPTSPAAPDPAPSNSSPPPAEKPTVPKAPSWMTQNEAQAFVMLNEARIRNGVSPIVAHQLLSEQARLKAKDMANNNYFAHTSPTYGSAGNMVRQAGVPFRSLGENLSRAGNVQQAHVQLEYSNKGHRQIMLNPNYNYVGIGIVPWQATPGIVMVQIFITQ
jgi:uncharacterized protein YkwD